LALAADATPPDQRGIAGLADDIAALDLDGDDRAVADLVDVGQVGDLPRAQRWLGAEKSPVAGGATEAREEVREPVRAIHHEGEHRTGRLRRRCG
jgi:hypothetical protein